MQLTDLLIGAVAYTNRGFITSNARIKLCDLVSKRAAHDLISNTNYSTHKFNIFKMELSNE